MIFFMMLMTEICLFVFCKIDIFSETISSGRTYFAIWVTKHYLTLLVESIQDHWVDQFSNMMGYLGEFFQDLWGSYRITLEL